MFTNIQIHLHPTHLLPLLLTMIPIPVAPEVNLFLNRPPRSVVPVTAPTLAPTMKPTRTIIAITTAPARVASSRG